MSSIHIHKEWWTLCRLSECWSWYKLWYDFILVNVSLDKAILFYFCVASGIWSYCEAQIFQGVYLFYSVPFAKNDIQKCLMFWDDHALSLLCNQLKSFVFTFDSDCCQDVLEFLFRVRGLTPSLIMMILIWHLYHPTRIVSECEFPKPNYLYLRKSLLNSRTKIHQLHKINSNNWIMFIYIYWTCNQLDLTYRGYC